MFFERPKRLDAKKAVCPNKLQPILLKEAAEEIPEPIAVMFGISLTSKVLPSDWKQANIKPIFKKWI